MVERNEEREGRAERVGATPVPGKHETRVRQEARRTAETARQEAKGFVEAQKDQFASKVSDIGNAFRAAANTCRDQGQESLRAYAERSAESVDRISQRIREREPSSVLSDLDGFARRNPAVFFSGAMALGFFAARFLKSSSERAYEGSELTVHEVPEGGEAV